MFLFALAGSRALFCWAACQLGRQSPWLPLCGSRRPGRCHFCGKRVFPTFCKL